MEGFITSTEGRENTLADGTQFFFHYKQLGCCTLGRKDNRGCVHNKERKQGDVS